MAVVNRAIAIASSPGQSNDVSDTSDDGDDTDGNTVDDPTVTEITPRPSIEISKTALIQDQIATVKPIRRYNNLHHYSNKYWKGSPTELTNGYSYHTITHYQ